MSSRSMQHPADGMHPQLLDIGKPRMAKADVQKLDVNWMRAVGRAIAQAITLAGLSKKEVAAKARVDAGELGKWVSGTRRPQIDRLFAVEEMRQPLVVSFAHLVDAFEIETTVRMRHARKAAGE